MKKDQLQSELNFYDSVFLNNLHLRNQWWNCQASKMVVNIIKKNNLHHNTQQKTALDLGCGDGRHIEYFRQLGYQTTGVDFSPEAIKLCQKKFKTDPRVILKTIDLTKKDTLKNLGQFDLILDWSVLDHIRKQYLKNYLGNILNALKPNGYLIASEFDLSIPGLFKNKNYKITNGHYSRAYSTKELVNLFPTLKVIDRSVRIPEHKTNQYKFNTLLLQNYN